MSNQVKVVFTADSKAVEDAAKGVAASLKTLTAEQVQEQIVAARATAALVKQQRAEAKENRDQTIRLLTEMAQAKDAALAEDKSRLAQAKSAIRKQVDDSLAETRRLQREQKAIREAIERDNAQSIETIRRQNAEAMRKEQMATATAEAARRLEIQRTAEARAAELQRRFNAAIPPGLGPDGFRGAAKSAQESASAIEAALRREERDTRLRAVLDAEQERSLLRRRRLAEAEIKLGELRAKNEREAEARSASFGNFASGVSSAAGFGIGFSPGGLALAAGAATGLVAIGASRQALELERTNAALIAVSGSSAQAAEDLGFIRKEADRLGLSVNDLSLQFSRFNASAKGTALEGEKSRQVFSAIVEAGGRLNLTNEQIQGSLNAVSQIISKGTVQAEELRGQLGDRLPGAVQIMARALGVTTKELDKMLRAGEVLAEDALPKFAEELRRTFNTDANTRIETTISNFTRLVNEIKLAASAFGELINKAASPAAGAIARILSDIRNDDELRSFGPDAQRAYLQQRNDAISAGKEPISLADFVQRLRETNTEIKQQIQRSLDPNNAIRPGAGGSDPSLIFRRGQNPAIDGAVGASLLSSGVPALDATAYRNAVRDRLKAEGKAGGDSELAIFEERKRAGEFASVNPLIVEEIRLRAVALDLQRQQTAAAKATRKEDSEAVRDLRAALALEEQQRDSEKAALIEQIALNRIAEQEARQGTRLNNVQRARIREEARNANTAGLSLPALQDEGARLAFDAQASRTARQFGLGAADRANSIIAQTGAASRGELDSKIFAARAAEELEALRAIGTLVDENGQIREDDARRIRQQAEASKALVEQLIREQDAVERSATVGARQALDRLYRDATDNARNASDAITGFFNQAANSIAQFATTGKFSFRSFAVSVIADLAQIASRAASGALAGILGKALGFAIGAATRGTGVPTNFTSGGFGDGNGLQNIAGPRALGGPTRAGRLYEVGEGGRPETYQDASGRTYLIPGNRGGKVIPAGQGGAGQPSIVIQQSFDFSGRSADDLVALRAYGEQIKRETVGAVADLMRRRLLTS